MKHWVKKEATIATRMYVGALKGEAIGKDDLEKALTRTEESQAIIEKNARSKST